MDQLPLTFMAHFEKTRLEEMKSLVEMTDTNEYQHFRATQNNSKLNAQFQDIQNQLNQMELHLSNMVLMNCGLSISPADMANYIRILEIYLNREEITRYRQAEMEVRHLDAMTRDLIAKNEELMRTTRRRL